MVNEIPHIYHQENVHVCLRLSRIGPRIDRHTLHDQEIKTWVIKWCWDNSADWPEKLGSHTDWRFLLGRTILHTLFQAWKHSPAIPCGRIGEPLSVPPLHLQVVLTSDIFWQTTVIAICCIHFWIILRLVSDVSAYHSMPHISHIGLYIWSTNLGLAPSCLEAMKAMKVMKKMKVMKAMKKSVIAKGALDPKKVRFGFCQRRGVSKKIGNPKL